MLYRQNLVPVVGALSSEIGLPVHDDGGTSGTVCNEVLCCKLIKIETN